MAKVMIDQARLKELLDYNPLTGVFTWRLRPGERKNLNTWLDGRIAGTIHTGKTGYKRRCIRVDGRIYRESRLAWLYMTGKWPEHTVDHINHNALDNRWANLRDVSQIENMYNQGKRKNNKSGVTGVSWDARRSTWFACIMVDRKTRSGGCFKTFEEAVAKRKELEKTYGFHPNHGVA